MKINKLSNYVYYYTDTVSDEEYNFIMSILLNNDGWDKVNYGDRIYNPDISPDDPESHNIMNSSKKIFKVFESFDYQKMSDLINKVFKETTTHYMIDTGIKDGNSMKPFDYILPIDKHLPGTTYIAHVDTVDSEETGIPSEGYTVLMYINDDYEGGEISFSKVEEYEYSKDGTTNLFFDGPIPTYPPDHEKNKGKSMFWVKPSRMSVLIFPPIYPPHAHTAHTVKGGAKFLIKGYWGI